MPPSHHSSSHHSSSHHSSSHHSSSHHSSSYRSHSSHSSSHHSYSGSRSSGSGFFFGSPSRAVHRSVSVRPRVNQPTGWHGAADSIRHYRQRNHDYDYYPQAWTAPDGRTFEEGYYDENGNHYRNLFVPGSSLMMVCEYCGNHMMYTCKEGELPVCPGCGAQFKPDVTDYVQTDAQAYPSSPANSPQRLAKVAVLVVVFFAAIHFVATIAMTILMAVLSSGSGSGSSSYSSSPTAASRRADSIYVEEIGRDCYRDGDDWYDSKTQCWFWFNDEQKPYQWQYWYEGISSDYGDYGWMEFDMDEQRWYIERRDGDWIVLPDKYDTSKLWHFTDEYVDPF